MGGCTSTKAKVIKPTQSQQDPKSFGKGDRSPTGGMSNLYNLAMRDIKGFRKSDIVSDIYDIKEVIGKGSFGEVLKAVHIPSGEMRAIKIIEKKKIQKHEILIKLLMQEFEILQETDHPHLMKVHELMEDEGRYYIISEMLEGGELYERILKIKRFHERDAGAIIHQVLLALNYMHKKNIVHRDIKPENILFQSLDNKNMTVKITDFGFAQFCEPEKGGLSDTLGSPLYMAPEIIKKIKYDFKVDVWSLGVITYILLTGRPPFSGKSKDEIFLQVSSKAVSYSDPIWQKISHEAQSFVKKCLTRDQRHRPSIDELLDSDWINFIVQKPSLTTEELLDIGKNLQSFRRYSVFQTGIMAYIMHFHEGCGEFDELRKVFLVLDKTNDGKLSLDEIREGLSQVMGKIKTKSREFEQIMIDLDKDCNGVIDYSEFITAAINKQRLLSTDNLEIAFSMMDTDKNGRITLEELREAFETHHKKDEKLWTQIMTEVDKNKDGAITMDEFSEVMFKVLEINYSDLNKMITAMRAKIRNKIQQMSLQQGQ